MKVKVSYTVDFDEIPEVITGLLQKCKAGLRAPLEKLKFVPHSPTKTMAALEDVRMALAAADNELQDITQLVAGWDSVANRSIEPQPQEPEDAAE